MEAFPIASDELRAGPQNVRVTATARLHFGFLDPSGRGSRPFGSLGLSLDRPQTRLTLRRSSALQTSGPERQRGEHYLRSIAAGCSVGQAFALDIEEAIPPHAGLGSGTQLALATGSAFAALAGVKLTLQDIAMRLGRGARSGIGIYTFEQGGVVLDSGPADGALPSLVARVPFPEAWRVILIFDPGARGLAGDRETAAFDSLPDFPAREAAELERRITQDALTAVAAKDFAAFSAEIGHLQACMGAYFAPLQGGPYVSKSVSGALAWLSHAGITGLGQSSWGPTGFALVESASRGETLLAGLRAATQGDRLRFALAAGRNEGAIIDAIS